MGDTGGTYVPAKAQKRVCTPWFHSNWMSTDRGLESPANDELK